MTDFEKRQDDLSYEIIKKEHDKNIWLRVSAFILLLICFILLIFLDIIGIFTLFSLDNIITYIICWVLTVAVAAALITALISIIKSVKASKCKTLRVYRDKLVGMEEKTRFVGFLHKTYYILYFNSGEYIIPKKNYKWSNMFCLNSKGLYNYSTVGDYFYLVSPRPTQIDMVYPEKLFDFKNFEDESNI